jgi:hypothetical protein
LNEGLRRELLLLPARLQSLRSEHAEIGKAMWDFAQAHPTLRTLTWAQDDLAEAHRAGRADLPEMHHLERELARPEARTVLDAWGRIVARYDAVTNAILEIERLVADKEMEPR